MTNLSRSLLFTLLCGTAQAAETKVPVKFSGGHETDAKDGGRPVVLIAAALEVKTEVFREAFSGVTPAKKDGGPSSEEARKNKDALMKVLKPLGVTNDRLDEVSNFYRYRPQKDELWKVAPAKAHAVVEDGKIKRIVVEEGGYGYSTPPKASVEGFDKVEWKAAIQFDKDLKKNVAVKAVEVAVAK